MLFIGETNKVKFDVNVMGTSTEPSVRVVLCSNPELSFKAAKEHENSWVVNMVIPDTVGVGDYDVKVEVLLNNRLFTPVKKRVTISKKDLAADKDAVLKPVSVVQVASKPATAPVKESGVLRTQTGKDKTSMIRRATVADEMKAILGSVSKVEPSPPKEVKITPAPTTSKLADIAKAPIKPLKKRTKPVTKEAVSISLSSISESVNTIETAPTIQPKLVKITEQATPISLIKGDVIFEDEE